MTSRVSAKTILGSGIAGLLLAGAVGTPAMAADAALINFTDDNFRACINAGLGQPADADITTEQGGSVTYLSCNSMGIESLTGAEELYNLTYLYASSNSITDATPLSGLSKLTSLSLAVNPLSDVSGIGGHPELSRVFLYQTGVNDISGLTDLPKIFGLYLSDTGVTDLTPLAGLPSLEQFAAQNNGIVSLAGIETLPNLSQLVIDGNQISDLTPLAQLSNMEQLLLSNNEISDVAPLAGLSSMWQLELSNNHIASLSTLGQHAALSELYADGQTLSLPDVLVDAVQANPVVSVDGVSIMPTSATATLDAAGNAWSFAAAGANELAWDAEVTIGSATGPFSGTITQASVAVPVIDPTDPAIDPETDGAAPAPVDTQNTGKAAVNQPLAQTGSDLSAAGILTAILLVLGGALATTHRLALRRVN
ncbi:leucine-rich repeat domain-containing protein [Lysinibacter cavernae]|uniref:Leucine-rich repeat domain-containing protein n=1 Tax=Lysinibacter cavernae TaxID=1640652 RepID=A0A7X5R2C1_9MICO|nr:leucine-rich repeat domain-containing protein [Lysinibacter cavernae]NIH54388.1 hypothetical protein [Lysinibacter cavernae]